jgi:hypothetical protein
VNGTGSGNYPVARVVVVETTEHKNIRNAETSKLEI